MYRYSSNITFLYYNDLKYGSQFAETILDLFLVMDQGFARIYQINKTSFLGVVKLSKEKQYTGNTLVSLNTNDVLLEYERIAELDIYDLTEIKDFPKIPLKSFFFKDKEGHNFEIEQFLEDKNKLF